MGALRGDQAPVTMVFGRRRGRKAVASSTLAGLTFEERSSCCSDHAPSSTCVDNDANHAGSCGATDSEASKGEEKTVPQTCVVVADVPVGHPASRDGIGPGWQLLSASREPWELKPFQSLS